MLREVKYIHFEDEPSCLFSMLRLNLNDHRMADFKTAMWFENQNKEKKQVTHRQVYMPFVLSHNSLTKVCQFKF